MGVMLAPPLLDGTIPAFYSTDQGIVITIPFSMNRVVGLNQVNGFQVKIKTIQSGNQLCSIRVGKNNSQTSELRVIIPSEHQNKFKVGQYYKVQIAYINGDTIGYYSSVTIGKYTGKPTMSIVHLNANNLNSHSYEYTGVYKQIYDYSERVYSYRFNLYGPDNQLLQTSGDLLHDSTQDNPETNGESRDSYIFAQDLDVGKTYRVEYSVTTVNGLTVTSPAYRITQKQSIQPEINAFIEASLNYNNGYVDVHLRTNAPDELASGFFIIARACKDTNYTVWEEIHRFSLMAQVANQFLCRDFTVEQGKQYVYGLQQYNNNNLRSKRLLSNTVYVDFEDAFLYDGKRQLKIKYNPKISSFKKDLLETKTDTIGGKHPFIFRNGRVYYTEFPISGLISYQMDDEFLFLSKKEYGLTEETTNLTSENIAAERLFKIKVLEWLTNGEPKIFRSPTEGNYVVRLMNTSLAPNDTLGRMLHTFSSTAYEVAEFTYNVLGNMNFISVQDQNMQTIQMETLEFLYHDEQGVLTTRPVNTNLLKYHASTVRFNNMTPGDIVKITFYDGKTEDIKIGVTGSYYIDTGVSISSIMLTAPSSGSMTYSYYYTKQPVFNTISDVEIVEVPQHQFIGEHDIVKELLYVYDPDAINDSQTLGAWIKNPKVELTEIYRLDIEKRPLQRESSEVNKMQLKDPFLIYELGTTTIVNSVSPNRHNTKFTFMEYYDAYNNRSYDQEKEYDPTVNMNGTNISVNDIERKSYVKPGVLTSLKSGNGTLTTLSYQMGVITFALEEEAYNNRNNSEHYLAPLGKAIAAYNVAVTSLNNALGINNNGTYIKNYNPDPAKIAECRAAVNSAYTTYIIKLVAGQKEESRR